MPLNLRQETFITAYLGEAQGNATKAARMAGYNGSDAVVASQGYELLKNPEIRTRVQDLKDRLGITQEWLLMQLMDIAQDRQQGNGLARVKAVQMIGMETHNMFVKREEPKHHVIEYVLERIESPKLIARQAQLAAASEAASDDDDDE